MSHEKARSSGDHIMYGTNDKGWSSRSMKHIVFHIQPVRYISITCMKTNYNRLIDEENVIIGDFCYPSTE